MTDPWPDSGSGVRQATFSPVETDQDVGGFFPSTFQFPLGPEPCGQFCAWSGALARKNSTAQRTNNDGIDISLTLVWSQQTWHD
jgi:hypothetical protein